MTLPRPLTTTAADNGLICGFVFPPDAPSRPIELSELESCLADDAAAVWLHFNAAHSGARRWLEHCGLIPAAALAEIGSHDDRCRLEWLDEGLLMVVNDLAFEATLDEHDVVMLWAWANPRLLITSRSHALKSTDALREQARRGLRAGSGYDLMLKLIGTQIELLQNVAERLARRIDHVEDQILIGRISEQRKELGLARRMCVQFRRDFAPLRTLLARLSARPTRAFSDAEAEALGELSDDLGFVVDEIAGLHERAKLLQEELAARLAEDNGRNLYVLTIFSAVFMPMTLLSGVFGMNVDAMPLAHGEHGFWAVAGVIGAAGLLTFAALVWKKFL